MDAHGFVSDKMGNNSRTNLPAHNEWTQLDMCGVPHHLFHDPGHYLANTLFYHDNALLYTLNRLCIPSICLLYHHTEARAAN